MTEPGRHPVELSLSQIDALIAAVDESPRWDQDAVLGAARLRTVRDHARAERVSPESAAAIQSVMDAAARHLDAEHALGELLRERYAGRWVAVRDHQVIASAPTGEELYPQLKGETGYRSFRVALSVAKTEEGRNA